MDDQAVRVMLAFILSLVAIFVTALIVGEENKAKWFKKREQHKSLFNRRGMLGEKWHFGHPRTWQGYVVFIIMFGVIGIISYILIFKW
jgi:hypothetical protein